MEHSILGERLFEERLARKELFGCENKHHPLVEVNERGEVIPDPSSARICQADSRVNGRPVISSTTCTRQWNLIGFLSASSRVIYISLLSFSLGSRGLDISSFYLLSSCALFFFVSFSSSCHSLASHSLETIDLAFFVCIELEPHQTMEYSLSPWISKGAS